MRFSFEVEHSEPHKVEFFTDKSAAPEWLDVKEIE